MVKPVQAGLNFPALGGSYEDVVSQSNELIDAAYTLSLTEKRLVLFAASKLNPSRPNVDTVRVYASEYAEAYGVTRGRAYAAMKESSVSLAHQKPITFKRNDGATVWTNWAGELAYHDGEGWIEYQFSSSIKEHFFDLEKKANLLDKKSRGHTTMKMVRLGKLKTFYALRLFEKISRFSGTGLYIVRVEDLRELMEIGKKYPAIKDFKLRVIDPAMKNINEVDKDLKLKYEQIKKGRTIVRLDFTFVRKQTSNEVESDLQDKNAKNRKKILILKSILLAL